MVSSDKPINILYCDSNIDGTVGGAQYSLFYLTDGLDKTRFHPIVVFLRDHALIKKYKEAGIETHVFPTPNPFRFSDLLPKSMVALPGLKQFLSITQSGINFFKFFVLTGIKYSIYLRKNRIKLVHLNNSIIRNNDWMLAAKLAHVKCITHERGINNYYPTLAKYFSTRIDAIVCISNAVKNNFIEKQIDTRKMVTIYNGLDPERIKVSKPSSAIKDEYRIGSTSPVVGVVGNIKEWKGQKTVIVAIEQVKKAFPEIVCLLVGDTAKSDQYYKDQLSDLIRDLKLEKNIIFTGYQANVPDFVNVMDVVLHSSVAPEPFGRVVIEAMALCKPIIGTRAGAIPEIILENETGLTYPPDKADDLANAMLLLLQNKELAINMGKRGYDRLVNHFHIKKNIYATQDLYTSLLD
jgi:glycosyltransferase involved in cell wall biosynthesis